MKNIFYLNIILLFNINLVLAQVNVVNQASSGVIGDVDKGEYEGNLKDGLYHGKGKLSFKDGRIYEGEFVEGLGMVMAYLQPLMVKNMKGNGKITISMEMELKFFLMVEYMKANFSLANLMVMGK